MAVGETQATTLVSVDNGGTTPPVDAIFATWNPAGKGSLITLSGSNLIMTKAGASGFTNLSAKSTIFPTTGKHFWELEPSTMNSNAWFGGLCEPTFPPTKYAGQDALSYGTYYDVPQGGNIDNLFRNSAEVAEYSTTCRPNPTIAGSVEGFAYDADAGTLAWYCDDVYQWTFDLAAGSYGPVGSINPNGESLILRSGQFGFIGTVPSGFREGLWTLP